MRLFDYKKEPEKQKKPIMKHCRQVQPVGMKTRTATDPS